LCYKIDLEPITHFLTGACLARAGFNRKTALATATMTLAAEAPDIDVLGGFKGPVYGFAHHRGFTHSFLGLFLVSAAVVGLIYLIWRLRGRRTNIPDLPPRWGLLFLFAYIAGLSHILLDFTNNYGVRPFWPFWGTWYSWDVAFIIEPALYVLLLAGIFLPEFFSRQRALRGVTAARLALTCVVAFWGIRAYEINRAKRALERQTFSTATPIGVSVYPYWSPVSRRYIALRWHAVVETREHFVSSEVNVWTGELDSSRTVFWPKPEDTPALLAAMQSELGRAYLDWARYPVVTEAGLGRHTLVQFRDLRFDYPRLREHPPLTASVELDGKLHIVAERLGSREQQPPD
jgi:inner membrane protein